jgi:hypothetical protein
MGQNIEEDELVIGQITVREGFGGMKLPNPAGFSKFFKDIEESSWYFKVENVQDATNDAEMKDVSQGIQASPPTGNHVGTVDDDVEMGDPSTADRVETVGHDVEMGDPEGSDSEADDTLGLETEKLSVYDPAAPKAVIALVDE